MPRVIGIDPGTVSIDLCGLDNGRLFLDRSIPTADALASPSVIIDALEHARPLDLIAGPSGYGVPLTNASDLTDSDLRLAYLAAKGEPGGIHGMGRLIRALAASSLPVVLTPGVVHLSSVPAYRKVNRVDMGTADKVCAVALAVSEQASRRICSPKDVSLILLELGGAFSAVIAVDNGRIVDGMGGTSGPMGVRAAGAFDGEVAYLAGTITKEMLFQGGVAAVAGMEASSLDDLAASSTARARLAWEAFVDSAVKAVVSVAVSAPGVPEVIVSGRAGSIAAVREALTWRLSTVMKEITVQRLLGFAVDASQAAQGAALIADGLAGGTSTRLVAALGIRDASGTVLDHLHVITSSTARARLGIPE